jgi:hypothetical protein
VSVCRKGVAGDRRLAVELPSCRRVGRIRGVVCGTPFKIELENGVLPPCLLPDPPVVYRSRLRGGSSTGYFLGRPLRLGTELNGVSVMGAILANRHKAAPKAPIE